MEVGGLAGRLRAVWRARGRRDGGSRARPCRGRRNIFNKLYPTMSKMQRRGGLRHLPKGGKPKQAPKPPRKPKDCRRRPVHSFKHLETSDENRDDSAQVSSRLIAVLWFQRNALTWVTSCSVRAIKADRNCVIDQGQQPNLIPNEQWLDVCTNSVCGSCRE